MLIFVLLVNRPGWICFRSGVIMKTLNCGQQPFYILHIGGIIKSFILLTKRLDEERLANGMSLVLSI